MLGKLEKVENQDRGATASLGYWRVAVYQDDPSSPECLLLTDGELARSRDRARKNPEDCQFPVDILVGVDPPIPWSGWALIAGAVVGIIALVWLT